MLFNDVARFNLKTWCTRSKAFHLDASTSTEHAHSSYAIARMYKNCHLHIATSSNQKCYTAILHQCIVSNLTYNSGCMSLFTEQLSTGIGSILTHFHTCPDSGIGLVLGKRLIFV